MNQFQSIMEEMLKGRSKSPEDVAANREVNRKNIEHMIASATPVGTREDAESVIERFKTGVEELARKEGVPHVLVVAVKSHYDEDGDVGNCMSVFNVGDRLVAEAMAARADKELN